MKISKVFIPDDSSSLSVGSEETFLAFNDQLESESIDIIRTGSRGLFWLEPLIEFETEIGRVGFKNVSNNEVGKILTEFEQHPNYIGLIDEIEFLKKQERVTFANCGKYNPLSVDDYIKNGGLTGLKKALTLNQEQLTEVITKSGLRGRGGAGFPTGIKFKTVLNAVAEKKYIVCNADEGDSGTYADRMLMEGDPFLLIEGMVIAGITVGALKGYIYLRSEYPEAFTKLKNSIDIAKSKNIIGSNLLGSNKSFDIEVRLGAGAYICGEETALLESLEGKRGQIRSKPPLPAYEGLFGFPTAVNNVITLATLPIIISKGFNFYSSLGSRNSRGTLTIQLTGNIKNGGLIEVPFGIKLREVLYNYGMGTLSGRPIKAVQVGGPLGAYWSEKLFDTPLDYETFQENGGMIGHGGIVVFDDNIDLRFQAKFAMEFCSIESCGKCTPCRIGSVRGKEILEKIIFGDNVEKNIKLLLDLCDIMENGSLCAFGGLIPIPVKSAIENFKEDFIN
ncbi:MAG: NADP-reducing hydrogenase subunit HndC [Alphaproteobacteria bacterium MarineAlpha2_Bin1]|nr:MAG: NADP-reducing hydrogenase subunit HndC [Alphaproteobacteria bacterium MarineAlpha2_Bin1]